MEERLQKILARAGYGSRRANEELILAGRVRVNGELAVLGMKADPNKDIISVDGVNLGRDLPNLVYFAAHKPRMMLSDDDPQDPRPKIRDLVPYIGHLFVVGRLDFESEGLILLTNDGELAHRLTHPRYEHEKEYRVLVATRPDEQQLTTWRRGVVLEDGYKTAPAFVNVESLAGKGTWLTVILKEGRKRQIREIGKTIGLPIVRIVRVRIGSFVLGNLKPRDWRELTPSEVAGLKTLQNREKPVRQLAPSSRQAGKLSRKPGTESRPSGRRPVGSGKPRPAGVAQSNRPTGKPRPAGVASPAGEAGWSGPSQDRPGKGRGTGRPPAGGGRTGSGRPSVGGGKAGGAPRQPGRPSGSRPAGTVRRQNSVRRNPKKD